MPIEWDIIGVLVLIIVYLVVVIDGLCHQNQVLTFDLELARKYQNVPSGFLDADCSGRK
jgi:hypothetical protein